MKSFVSVENKRLCPAPHKSKWLDLTDKKLDGLERFRQKTRFENFEEVESHEDKKLTENRRLRDHEEDSDREKTSPIVVNDFLISKLGN